MSRTLVTSGDRRAPMLGHDHRVSLRLLYLILCQVMWALVLGKRGQYAVAARAMAVVPRGS